MVWNILEAPWHEANVLSDPQVRTISWVKLERERTVFLKVKQGETEAESKARAHER